jgi:tetratricopeptide (TPR) repeat protein
MRDFHGRIDDKQNGIDRAYFDVEHGRVHLGLERLVELAAVYRDDAAVHYAEGLIRQNYLGQGVAALGHFERAWAIDKRHILAAGSACNISRSEQEFKQWAARFELIAPRDSPYRALIDETLQELQRGTSYWYVRMAASEQASSEGDFGLAAAMMEAALISGLEQVEIDREMELNARRKRAQCIRELDRGAVLQRESMGEAFPPDERIALQEAMTEVDSALRTDDGDAVLHTLKSAWCTDLGRYQEAIQHAKLAIGLRPHAYAKPWFNQTNAFWQLGQTDDARRSAQEALRQAQDTGDASDIEQAKEMIQAYSRTRKTPEVDELMPLVRTIQRSAQRTCEEEIGQWSWPLNNLDNLVKAVLGRRPLLDPRGSAAFVPLLEKLLKDVTPESAFCALQAASLRDSEAVTQYFEAGLYVAAHATGVLKRDAARFLALYILADRDGEEIRDRYRRMILEVAAVAQDDLSKLDSMMRDELRRILIQGSQAIADQPEIDTVGEARGKELAQRLAVGVAPAKGAGCQALLVLGTVAAVLAARFLLQLS